MSDANIERLLQLSAPRSERAAPARARDPLHPFSDQLSLLTVLPPPRRPAINPPAAIAPIPHRDRTDERQPPALNSTPIVSRAAQVISERGDTNRETIAVEDATSASEQPEALDAASTSAVVGEENQPSEEVAHEERSELNDDRLDAAAIEATISAAPAASHVDKSGNNPVSADKSENDNGEAVTPTDATPEESSDRGQASVDPIQNSTVEEGKAAERSADKAPANTADAAVLDRSSAGQVEASLVAADAESTAERDPQQSDVNASAENDDGAAVSDANREGGVQSSKAAQSLEAERNSRTPSVEAATEPTEGESAKTEDVEVNRTQREAVGERTHEKSTDVDERPQPQDKESGARSQLFVKQSSNGATQPIATVSVAPPTINETALAGGSDEKPAASPSVRTDVLPATLNRGPLSGGVRQGGESDESAGVSRVDTARFVGRVARAFHFAQERGGTLQLRLSPPELGSLRLELTVKDGVLTANLEAETPAARRLLLDHLPALRDRLAEQNVRVERFDVDVRREGNDGQRNTSQHEQQPSWQERQQQHSQAPHAPERRSSKVQSQAPLESINQPAISNSGINLVI